MSTQGESEPESWPDVANEAVQQELITDCMSECVACSHVMRSFDETTDFVLDDALAELARVTDSTEIASSISEDATRLETLAEIASRTGDELLAEAVHSEATELFGDQKYTAPLQRIACALGSTSLLETIADPEVRDQAVWSLAVRSKDPAIINGIQDEERRTSALVYIVAHAPRDFRRYLDMMDEEGRQRAITERAREQRDIDLAAEINDITDRAYLLLTIAKYTEGKKISDELPELLKQVSDKEPTHKAMLLKQYMDLSGSTEQAPALLATARQIEDPLLRTYFLAAVVARTGDTDIADEVKSVLDEAYLKLSAEARDSIYAGLATGLNDLQYTYTIRNDGLRVKTQRMVITKTGDSDAALTLKDTVALHSLILANNDVELAVRMAESEGHVGVEGLSVILKLALKMGDIAPILQIKDRWKRKPLLIQYLIDRDDLEATEAVEDERIRKQAQIGIAEQRGDIELAHRLDATKVVKKIEAALLGSNQYGKGLPLAEIELIQDLTRRETLLYPYLSDGDPIIKAKIAACIRGRARGQRFQAFLGLAQRTHDPSLAFEALHDLRGMINDSGKILAVSKALRIIQNPELP